jgi:hypothetical protein
VLADTAYDNSNYAVVSLVEVSQSSVEEKLSDINLQVNDQGDGGSLTEERSFSVAEGATANVEFDLTVYDSEFKNGDSCTW